MHSKAVTSSSSTCSFLISATVCVGLQVKSLLAGWCFLTWRWSEAKGRSGNASVQLGSYLPQASGPRAQAGNGSLTLFSALMLPGKGALKPSCSPGSPLLCSAAAVVQLESGWLKQNCRMGRCTGTKLSNDDPAAETKILHA